MENMAIYALYLGFCVIFYEICHRLKACYTYLL
jgi:hypothetical protein